MMGIYYVSYTSMYTTLWTYSEVSVHHFFSPASAVLDLQQVEEDQNNTRSHSSKVYYVAIV